MLLETIRSKCSGSGSIDHSPDALIAHTVWADGCALMTNEMRLALNSCCQRRVNPGMSVMSSLFDDPRRNLY